MRLMNLSRSTLAMDRPGHHRLPVEMLQKNQGRAIHRRTQMPRYSERQLQWRDILGRFEAYPCAHHLHNALDIVDRLKDEGAKYWDEDSQELKSWQRYCTAVWSFLNNLGQRRDLRQQSLETAMREFIQEFEHSIGRMCQMLYGAVADSDRDEGVREIVDLCNLAYIASTYALVSGWISDKQENASLSIIVNLNSGEVREKGTRTEMQVPRKYRRSTKLL